MSDPTPLARIRASFPPPQTTLQSPLSIPEQRIAWEEQAVARHVMLPAVVVEPVEGPVPGLLVSPRTLADSTLVLYAHGGGFVMGSPKTHQNIAVFLANAAVARVLLVDYRLAPEHRFPAARDDFLAVYRSLLAAGEDARKIVFAGDSAGAHVVMSALLAMRGTDIPAPAAVVLISPWLDLAQRGPTMQSNATVDPLVLEQDLDDCARMYLGDVSPLAPEVDVLAADPRGYPPLLVHSGADEILLSDHAGLATRVWKAGGQVEQRIFHGLWHVFHAWVPELPEATDAIAEIAEFVVMHTRPQRSAY